MNRSDFFKHLIDGYLMLDLRNMSELEQKDDENGGGVGYPMLATCVSGMELLGGVLYNGKYNHHKDWDYFEHYWNEYLTKVDARYAPFAKLFWKLVRNGVAHTYMAKAAITVTKGQQDNHLIFHNGGAQFNIDCRQFYLDFLASYQQHVKPKLAAEGDFTVQVQKSIDILLQESDDLCKKIFAELQPPAAPNPALAGASGPTGPTPSGTQPPATMATTTTVIPHDVHKRMFRARISGASGMTQKAAESLKRQRLDEPPPTMSGMV